jgi:hypothetical protein
MATEDIVFKVSVDSSGEGAKSLKSLKAEFKQLQAELERTQVGTIAYQKALERLGNVKDEIGDLRDTITALNPEGKVQAFANVAGKLAGGFQAATGAAALFGVQSEELEKQLLKVQAATALAQGIQSVVGLSDAFKVLGTVIAANPIMFLAAGIAAITAATILWIKETDEAAASNERLNESLKEQERITNSIKKSNDTYLKSLKANGAAELELIRERIKQSEQNVERQKAAAETQLAILKNSNEEEKKANYDKYVSMFQDLQAFDAEVLSAKKELTDFLIEEDKRQREAQIKNANLAAAEVTRLNHETARNAELLRWQNEQAEMMMWENNTFPRLTLIKTKEVELFTQSEAQKRAEQKKTHDDKKLLEDELLRREAARAKAREDIDKNYWNAVSDLSISFFNFQLKAAQGNAKKEDEIRKKQFQANKAFSATKATIEGINAVQGVLAQSLTYGPLTIPLALSMGVATAANVAKILSTQYNSASTSTNDVNLSAGAPQIQTQAPNIGNPLTRLNEQGQNQSLNNRVYVLESDISESQTRVARLQEQATF